MNLDTLERALDAYFDLEDEIKLLKKNLPSYVEESMAAAEKAIERRERITGFEKPSKMLDKWLELD